MKSPSSTLRNSSPPIVPRRGDAPTTATLVGSKNERSDATTAVWSRSSTLCSNRSVAAIGNCTSTTPLGELALELEAGPLEDTEHRRGSRENLGDEALDPDPGSAGRQALEQSRPDASALLGVGDGKGGLGHGRIAQTHVVADRDDPLPALVRQRTQQSAALDPIRIEERLDELRPQVRKAVEAAVEALARKRSVEVEQRLAIRVASAAAGEESRRRAG